MPEGSNKKSQEKKELEMCAERGEWSLPSESAQSLRLPETLDLDAIEDQIELKISDTKVDSEPLSAPISNATLNETLD